MVDQIPASAACVVELICAEDRTEELNHHWDHLAGQGFVDNPFSERWNLQPALRLLADEEPVKLLLIWRDSDRQMLDALIPVVERHGLIPSMAHLEFWLHRYAYIGMPLIRTGYTEATITALNLWLDHSEFCLLVFPQCYESFAQEIRAKQPTAFIEDVTQRACLNTVDYKDGFKHHSAKKAKEYRRQLRRLQDQNYQLRQLSVDDTADSISEVFLNIEASGWKGRAQTAFLSKHNDEVFLRQIVSAALAADRLGLYYLSKLSLQEISHGMAGQVVAILLTIRTDSSELLFKTGFDENYARFSPGVLNVLSYSEKVVSGQSIDFCDSGALPDHPMINKVWLDRLELCTFVLRKRTKAISILLTLRTTYQWLKQFVYRNSPQKG